MAAIFSCSISWVNCAADYNVCMPVNTPRWWIFGATYVGIFLPSVLVQSLGAALYTGTIAGGAEWKSEYQAAGVGGLLKVVLEPAGGCQKTTSQAATRSRCTRKTSAPGPSASHE